MDGDYVTFPPTTPNVTAGQQVFLQGFHPAIRARRQKVGCP
jgi:hypothetical protein